MKVRVNQGGTTLALLDEETGVWRTTQGQPLEERYVASWTPLVPAEPTTDAAPAPRQGPEPTDWWCGNCGASGDIPAPEACPNCEVGRIHEGSNAAREADEVSKLWGMWPVQEVAVVVFVRSRGADRADARDRAVAAVQRAVALGSENSGRLEVMHRGQVVAGGSFITVDGVSELGRAAGNGLITVQPTSRGFE